MVMAAAAGCAVLLSWICGSDDIMSLLYVAWPASSSNGLW
jgi:hypothetical protein